jgi:hypothetical protein
VNPCAARSSHPPSHSSSGGRQPFRCDDLELIDEQNHATTMPATASRGDLLTGYEDITSSA